MMSSTIGYLPSYLKKKSELSMSMSKLQVMKEKESQESWVKSNKQIIFQLIWWIIYILYLII